MEMKDKIYFYNPKYPEYGISEMPVLDIMWVNSVVDGRHLYISAIVSKFDIETEREIEYSRSYAVYNPYTEDDDMFVYDLPGNRERVLSFNRAKLEEWWYEDVKTRYNIMKKRLGDLEECLKQK